MLPTPNLVIDVRQSIVEVVNFFEVAGDLGVDGIVLDGIELDAALCFA
jgi:hypothetical protein